MFWRCCSNSVTDWLPMLRSCAAASSRCWVGQVSISDRLGSAPLDPEGAALTRSP
jgi:hypothetical protein